MRGVGARSRRTTLGVFAGALLTSAFVVAACGIDVIGTATPPTSFDGSVRDGPLPADGSVIIAEDGALVVDASGLPLVDAGGGDGAVEAGPSVDFCAAQLAIAPYVYCNDFETGTVGFDSSEDDDGDATVDVVTTASGSNPNKALRIELPEESETRSAYVRQPLGKLSQMGEGGYDVSFLFMVRKSSLDYAVLGGPFLAAAAASRTGKAIGAAAYSNGNLLDYAGSNGLPLVPALPGDVWHVGYVRYGKSLFGPFTQVVIDGFTVDVVLVDESPALDLRLGAYLTSADRGEIEVVFDDVLVRTF